jgi:hypothetical protein
MMKKLLSAGALVALGAGLLIGPAGADPDKARNSQVIPVTCDDGQTYNVVVAGNGDFTPGHVVGSNSMFIPVEFGQFTATAQPSGAVFSEPGPAKGQSAKNGQDLVTCSFGDTFPVTPEEAEEFGLPAGTTHVDFAGTVTGFFTPARR